MYALHHKFTAEMWTHPFTWTLGQVSDVWDKKAPL